MVELASRFSSEFYSLPLIIHKTGIKVWRIVRVWRGDMSRATREGILQKVKHAEEFSGWQMHVVAKKAEKIIS